MAAALVALKSNSGMQSPQQRRAPSGIPNVKCSACGREISINELADHVCSKSPPSPSPTSRSATPVAQNPGRPLVAIPPGDHRAHSPTPPRNRSPGPHLAPAPGQRPVLTRAASDTPPGSSRGPPLTLNIQGPSSQPQRPQSSFREPPLSPTRSLSAPNTNPRSRAGSSASQRVPHNRDRGPPFEERTTPLPIQMPPPQARGQQLPSPLSPTHPEQSPISISSPDQDWRGSIPTLSLHIPDTESGGSAGRAGVGRRAFAAVAHAALLATSYSHSPHSPSISGFPPPSPNAPNFQQYMDMGGRGTPPLSIPRSSPSPHIPDIRTPSPGFISDPRVATSPTSEIGVHPGRHMDAPINFHSGAGSRPPIEASRRQNGWAGGVQDNDSYHQNHPLGNNPNRSKSPGDTSVSPTSNRFQEPPLPSSSTPPLQLRKSSLPSSRTEPVRSTTLDSEPGLGYLRGGDSVDLGKPAIPKRSETDPASPPRRDRSDSDASLPYGRRPSVTSESSASSRGRGLRMSPSPVHISPSKDSVPFPSNGRGRPSLEEDRSPSTRGRSASIASSTSSYTTPTIPPDDARLSVFTTVSTVEPRVPSNSAPLPLAPRRSKTTDSSSSSSSDGSGPVIKGLASRRISKSLPSVNAKNVRVLESLKEEEVPSISTSPTSITSQIREELVGRSKFTESPDVVDNKSLTIPSSSLADSARLRTKSGPSSTISVSSSTSGPSTSGSPRKKRRPRICVKCGKTITDGRWVPLDKSKITSSASTSSHGSSGSSSWHGHGLSSSERKDVLCEDDWKEMYLPKCRRCGLTIESHAVSSADGQLKGKYHPACFNCTTCHKPFPDKEFYVFSGQPYCDYHYHVVNNSLCASSSCGLPIEGPCAEDHDGRRYHPEHLVCSVRGCGTRLVEYWCDSDGRMFCERHLELASLGRAREGAPTPHFARDVDGTDKDEDDDHPQGAPARNGEKSTGDLLRVGPSLGTEPLSLSRAEKRRTRFLNLI